MNGGIQQLMVNLRFGRNSTESIRLSTINGTEFVELGVTRLGISGGFATEYAPFSLKHGGSRDSEHKPVRYKACSQLNA